MHALALVAVLAPAVLQAPDSIVAPESAPPVAAAPAQTGNLLNPNVSVIGWLQGSAGDDPRWHDPAAVLKEAELGLQSTVDPYSKADVFIAFHDEEAPELEEGYLTFLSLPAGLQARVGKFRNGFGRFNLTHPGETPFADRPLAASTYLGEDGLASTGAELSWLVPLPVYLQLAATIERAPDASGVFGLGPERGDLLYVGRASFYADVTDDWNVSLGASAARGPRSLPIEGSQADFDVDPAAHASLLGADAVLRWKNRRFAIYRSLAWHTEIYRAHQDDLPPLCDGTACTVVDDAPGGRWGGFSFVDYQFARRWHAGVRGDYVQDLASDGHTAGGLGFVTFTPSEFSLVSAQVRRVRYDASTTATEAFLKITFNIGPHGAHPF